MREKISFIFIGFLIGSIIGWLATDILTPGGLFKGHYFCCNAAGNCVISVDAHCDTPLKWCAVTGTKTDGTIYCKVWG